MKIDSDILEEYGFNRVKNHIFRKEGDYQFNQQTNELYILGEEDSKVKIESFRHFKQILELIDLGLY